MISSHFIGCPPGQAEQQSIPLLIIRKSYDKIKKDLYDFFTIPARPYSIISRMISSLVSFMPFLPRRPMPLMVVSMSFITMPSPPLNS